MHGYPEKLENKFLLSVKITQQKKTDKRVCFKIFNYNILKIKYKTEILSKNVTKEISLIRYSVKTS